MQLKKQKKKKNCQGNKRYKKYERSVAGQTVSLTIDYLNVSHMVENTLVFSKDHNRDQFRFSRLLVDC